MKSAQNLQAAGALAALLWLSGCAESFGPSQGWGMVDLPDVSPTSAEVVEAARLVIQERYPRSAVSEKSGVVVALGPVTMDGGSKTRTQISVLAKRNYTGAYEPVVRVCYCVEVAQPEVLADPGSASLAKAQPIGRERWHVLEYRPYEEQDIYNAILDRLIEIQTPPGKTGDPATEGDDRAAGVEA